MPSAAADGGLRVGWGGRQVGIQVTATEARAAVEAMFAALLELPRGSPVGQFTVRHGAQGYAVADELELNRVEGPLPEALHHLRYRVSRDLRGARPELLWLHGAGVAREGQAVLIVGPSGCGKSTLATSLTGRGFTYLGDDLVPLDVRAGTILPFPVSPAVRLHPGRFVAPELVRGLPKAEVALPKATIGNVPVPVGLVVFPAYEPGVTRMWRWSGSQTALELLRHCVDLPDHSTDAVRELCRVVPAWPALRLLFDDADRAATLVVHAHVAARGASVK